MARQWNPEDVLKLASSFQAACVLAAGADLDVFTRLKGRSMSAGQVAEELRVDPRGVRILLDALAAIDLLSKNGESYSVPADVAEILTAGGPNSRLAMAQHQANCLRGWSQLARAIQSGEPSGESSVRGPQADRAAFIEAMDNVGRTLAGPIVSRLQPVTFRHLLDIGGASGTYTIAWLREAAGARATIFDLPEVIPFARTRVADAGLADRVDFVPGDFYKDDLPRGADFAWISAIIHQNSPEQNRDLYRKAFAALVPGGQVAVRDFVMESSRTHPMAGAMFAVNMLANTRRGDTYTFDEIRADLESVGFGQVTFWRKGEGMDSVVRAVKPG